MSRYVHYRYQRPPRVEITPSDGYYDMTVAQRMQIQRLFVHYWHPEYRERTCVEVLDTRTNKVWTVYRPYNN